MKIGYVFNFKKVRDIDMKKFLMIIVLLSTTFDCSAVMERLFGSSNGRESTFSTICSGIIAVYIVKQFVVGFKEEPSPSDISDQLKEQYNNGHYVGYTRGFEQGSRAGFEAGKKVGFEEGEKIGFEAGRKFILNNRFHQIVK